jgi:hypothetical protein
VQFLWHAAVQRDKQSQSLSIFIVPVFEFTAGIVVVRSRTAQSPPGPIKKAASGRFFSDYQLLLRKRDAEFDCKTYTLYLAQFGFRGLFFKCEILFEK